MKKYTFKPYNDLFPALFEKERARILARIDLSRIEHVGSTAVPGLGGKGIIDIAIAVEKGAMEQVSRQLQEIGYEFKPSFSSDDRLYLITDLEEQRYHIHLTYPENREWKNFLAFRDYLRAHPEEARGYAEVKKQAALDADGLGEKYRKIKGPLMEKILIKQAKILIREMEKDDLPNLIQSFCFPWSSPQATSEKWARRLENHETGKRTVFLIVKGKEIVGYGSLLPESEYPEFKAEGIAEINDLWVAETERHQGLGKMLIQYIENKALERGFKQIGLGVGLYRDYGAAQKLYCQLGYVPDGHGITHNYRPAIPGENYPLDDELLLWLKKSLLMFR